MGLADLHNRLVKNQRHRRKWARRLGLDAYRVYDRDIPEIPLIVERFGSHAVVWDKTPPWKEGHGPEFSGEELRRTVASALEIDADRCRLRRRRIQGRDRQYDRLSTTTERLLVREGPLRFWVDLDGRLDTGLFLDHRPLRAKLAAMEGSGRTMLNLFAYTGSLSVAAARAGFHTTSMDLSPGNLDRARENFRANDLPPQQHSFEKTDIMEFLRGAGEKRRWDLIVIDPPTFSRSGSMRGTLDIQRDHSAMLLACSRLLGPTGELVFSCNKRKLQFRPPAAADLVFEDISRQSIPEDFRDTRVHHCFRATRSHSAEI